MDIDELVDNIIRTSSKCFSTDLRKRNTMEEVSFKIKNLIEQHDQKLIKGYINLLPEIQRTQVCLASEITRARYGLQGIYEDFPEDCKERVEAERDYWKSLVDSIITEASKVLNENKKIMAQVEDNSKENL